MSHLQSFARDESGATSIEYAFIAALIGIAIISSLQTAGSSVTNAYQHFATELDDARNNAQSAN